MQTVTASQIKQNSTLLQNALRDDLLITKRNNPYVVVLDYKRYQSLIRQAAMHDTVLHDPSDTDTPLTRRLAGIFADSAPFKQHNGEIDDAIDAAYHQTLMKKYHHADA